MLLFHNWRQLKHFSVQQKINNDAAKQSDLALNENNVKISKCWRSDKKNGNLQTIKALRTFGLFAIVLYKFKSRSELAKNGLPNHIQIQLNSRIDSKMAYLTSYNKLVTIVPILNVIFILEYFKAFVSVPNRNIGLTFHYELR